MSAKTVMLDQLSWPEVRERLRARPIVVIPTGSIEQHGPHLPLQVDARIAAEVARAAAEKVQAHVPVLVAPVLSVGCSEEHLSFAGTLSFRPETFMAVAREVVLSLLHHGATRFFFLNAHAGNGEALQLVARTLRAERDALVAVASYWQIAREEMRACREGAGGGVNHAGEEETSLMLFFQKDLVNMSAARPNTLRWRSAYLSGDYAHDPAVAYGRKRGDIAPLGHNGDPTLASSEKGQRLFSAIVDAVARFLLDFNTWQLNEMVNPPAKKT